MFDKIDEELLLKTDELHQIKMGAYSIRKNGERIETKSTEHILIEPNKDSSGLKITVKRGTKGESLHIPVILSKAGLTEVVRNDFIIEDDCDITIVAGCGIHSSGKTKTEHDGVHSFVVGKNSTVSYIEKHYAFGDGAKKEMNPKTEIVLNAGASFNMNTYQIGGVTNSSRITSAVLKDGAKLNIDEKILTEKEEVCNTNFVLELEGKDSSAHIVSKAVAKDSSKQSFKSILNGKNKCFGHTECDCIIVGDARVVSTPEVNALCSDATLVHEAAIGKIAGEQITKLMTLGLSEDEAQNEILRGFLK